jgi:outer membrane protein insertion porin family
MRGAGFYRVMAACLAAAMFVPVAAFAQETLIAEIKIVGNERVSNEAILAAIVVKPGMSFTEQAAQEAKQAIQNMGYFDRVIVGTETVDAGVRVVFNVVENPVVKDIKITGNTVVETEKLRSLMRTSIGSVLNMGTLQQDIKAIEEYYSDQGFIAAVTEEVGVDPQTGVLTIPILEVRVEDIRVAGNKKTHTNVVIREMELKPGDVYNQRVLFRDLQRVYNLDIFDRETADPYRVEPGSDIGKVIITIPVKEKKTGELSVGIGYSSRQKLVGQARLSENNFRGRAQTVNLLWEQSADRGSSYEVGFFEPWMDGKHTSLGVNLYNKLIFRFTSSLFGTSGAGAITDYSERRKGGSVTFSRPFGHTSRGFFTARSESVDTTLTDISSPLLATGTVTSGTFRFTNSSRDSEIDPLTGGYNSYAVEVGDANSPFTKYSIDLRRYFSRGGPRKELNERRKVPAVRLLVGSLTGNVPFFEQYFMGGAETLRGYREDRFWGRNMLLLNSEYRVPMASSLMGVVFVDYGDAWGAPSEFRQVTTVDEFGTPVTTDLIPGLTQHESFSPSLGYGVGIRVATPLGPVRLDYGFGSEGSRAHFSIGHAF